MKIINKLGYFFWFIVTAPLCVKMKYETPATTMFLVSWYIWSCVVLSVLGSVFNWIGVDYATYSGRWYAFIIKDPYAFFGDIFFYALVSLILFYAYATINGLWNKDEIRNTLNGWK